MITHMKLDLNILLTGMLHISIQNENIVYIRTTQMPFQCEIKILNKEKLESNEATIDPPL